MIEGVTPWKILLLAGKKEKRIELEVGRRTKTPDGKLRAASHPLVGKKDIRTRQPGVNSSHQGDGHHPKNRNRGKKLLKMYWRSKGK